jgi:hypothetical protein
LFLSGPLTILYWIWTKVIVITTNHVLFEWISYRIFSEVIIQLRVSSYQTNHCNVMSINCSFRLITVRQKFRNIIQSHYSLICEENEIKIKTLMKLIPNCSCALMNGCTFTIIHKSFCSHLCEVKVNGADYAVRFEYQRRL